MCVCVAVQVREKNLAQFESALVELEKKHALEVDRRIQDTQQGLAEVRELHSATKNACLSA
jgi:hypothetical protein